MEKKDIVVYWNDTKEEIVGRLLDLLEDRNFISSNISLKFPNGFEVESAFVGKSSDDKDEWYFHGWTEEMEGDIRIKSLPDEWLSIAATLLCQNLGIVMTGKQQKIDEMFTELSDLIYTQTEYLDWPNDDISYIDDIDKVLEGEADQDSAAAEYYGNGEFTMLGLYKERAGLQLSVIKELFGNFISMANKEEEDAGDGEDTDK